jgi:hypothetical protein
MFLEIPFLQAFEYCCNQPIFVTCALITTIACVLLGVWALPKQEARGKVFTILAILVAIAIAWVIIPATMSANTTPEQAARGVFIWGA